jgi:hypothetical protein
VNAYALLNDGLAHMAWEAVVLAIVFLTAVRM